MLCSTSGNAGCLFPEPIPAGHLCSCTYPRYRRPGKTLYTHTALGCVRGHNLAGSLSRGTRKRVLQLLCFFKKNDALTADIRLSFAVPAWRKGSREGGKLSAAVKIAETLHIDPLLNSPCRVRPGSLLADNITADVTKIAWQSRFDDIAQEVLGSFFSAFTAGLYIPRRTNGTPFP